MNIATIHARQILDSRGYPTIETDVILEDGSWGRAAVPSGASTGAHEALELRDNNPSFYQGKSVQKAINNVNTAIAKRLKGKDVTKQEELDNIMIDLDGTENKSKIGANAILSVSLACAHAAANSRKLPLFAYFQELAEEITPLMPVPMMNIVNGGKHAAGTTDIQEFMILPIGASFFSEALEMGANIFHALGDILHEKGYATTVGDEGGYAPHLNGNKEALDLIIFAVEKAGYKIKEDVVLALDIAASELYSKKSYILKKDNHKMTTDEMIAFLQEMIKEYPIISLEDALSEDDHAGWQQLTSTLGQKIQLVGDDLFVTNTKRLERGIKNKEANSILIKFNQIGTLTETIATVKMAKKAGWTAIISHRSAETEDTTISHLAVGLATGQIKTGSLSRSDRIAKYNELLRIEEILGDRAIYLGKEIFKKWHT
jgi:enolase